MSDSRGASFRAYGDNKRGDVTRECVHAGVVNRHEACKNIYYACGRHT